MMEFKYNSGLESNISDVAMKQQKAEAERVGPAASLQARPSALGPATPPSHALLWAQGGAALPPRPTATRSARQTPALLLVLLGDKAATPH